MRRVTCLTKFGVPPLGGVGSAEFCTHGQCRANGTANLLDCVSRTEFNYRFFVDFVGKMLFFEKEE